MTQQRKQQTIRSQPARRVSHTSVPKAPVVVRPSRKPGSPNPMIMAAVVGIGFAGVLILVIITLLAVYAYYQVSGVIYPGVRAGNTRLDGMSVTQAAAELDKIWNLENQLRVTSGLQTVLVSPADIGLNLNALQTAQNAHEVGHGNSPIEEFMQLLVCINEGWQVTPIVYLDEEAARSGLEALSPSLSMAPRDASVRLDGETLQAVPGLPGYTVDLEATYNILAADPKVLLGLGTVQVILKQIPPQITDVTALIGEAQALIDTPTIIKAFDALQDEILEWEVSRQVVASWLTFGSGSDSPEVRLDADQVRLYLDGLSASLSSNRYLDAERFSTQLADALLQGKSFTLPISHPASTYLVQPGDTLLKIGWNLGIPFWMIMEANPGLNEDNLWAGAEINIPSKDSLLPLPAIPGKRIVISISSQRLWAYQDKALLRQYPISTGIDRSPTQPGIFQVQTHESMAYASVWDLYMPNFMGVYEAWPGFMNGIHGLPTLSNGQRLWANILGRPASYGCIILDLDAADWLYQWAENGVVVEITP